MGRDFTIDANWYFTLTNRLKNLREDAGMSQAELARQSGLSAAAISLLEKGDREPSLKSSILLAQALGVSLDSFAGLKEYPHNETTVRIELVKAKQRLSKILNIAKD